MDDFDISDEPDVDELLDVLELLEVVVPQGSIAYLIFAQMPFTQASFTYFLLESFGQVICCPQDGEHPLVMLEGVVEELVVVLDDELDPLVDEVVLFEFDEVLELLPLPQPLQSESQQGELLKPCSSI